MPLRFIAVITACLALGANDPAWGQFAPPAPTTGSVGPDAMAGYWNVVLARWNESNRAELDLIPAMQTAPRCLGDEAERFSSLRTTYREYTEALALYYRKWRERLDPLLRSGNTTDVADTQRLNQIVSLLESERRHLAEAQTFRESPEREALLVQVKSNIALLERTATSARAQPGTTDANAAAQDLVRAMASINDANARGAVELARAKENSYRQLEARRFAVCNNNR